MENEHCRIADRYENQIEIIKRLLGNTNKRFCMLLQSFFVGLNLRDCYNELRRNIKERCLLMLKRSMKETIVRVVILLVGLTIAHLGVTLFLLADLGADPFNVLVQGVFRMLAKVTGWGLLTHGYTHISICFLIILVLLIVDRSYVKIGTILCMVCGGPIIDFFTYLLGPLFTEESGLWVKLPVLAAGCVILAFGMTIVIKSDAGTGPNDLVALVISDKAHAKFSIVRVIVDASFVAAGFCLGGVFGIGTIICAGLVGPTAGICLPVSEKIVDKVLGGVLK